MKIAITSTEADPASQVDQRFGRAAFFAIYNTDNGQYSFILNDCAQAAHGVGVAAAQKIIDEGAQQLVTGQCGPNAERTLIAAGIKINTGFEGTVAQAVEKYAD